MKGSNSPESSPTPADAAIPTGKTVIDAAGNVIELKRATAAQREQDRQDNLRSNQVSSADERGGYFKQVHPKMNSNSSPTLDDLANQIDVATGATRVGRSNSIASAGVGGDIDPDSITEPPHMRDYDPKTAKPIIRKKETAPSEEVRKANLKEIGRIVQEFRDRPHPQRPPRRRTG